MQRSACTVSMQRTAGTYFELVLMQRTASTTLYKEVKIPEFMHVMTSDWCHSDG
ncbi:hypothetical protein A2U01_0109012, partial [Trifolium medium]|nr:hypothetical protein [Trifolium medium]